MFSHTSGAHALLLLACGCLGLSLSTRDAQTSVPPSSGRLQLVGSIEHLEEAPGGVHLRLRVHQVDGLSAAFVAALSSQEVPRPALHLGQQIAVTTRLKAYPLTSNPGERDSEGLYRRRGQLFRGSFEAARVARLSPVDSWREWMAHKRARLNTLVRKLAPDAESGAFFLTLSSGERDELSPTAEADFSRSGLAHVLSVSGLHVAALALALLWLLRWGLVRSGLPVVRRVDPRRLAALACVPLLWSYVVFTGSQPPAVRSAVMATAYFVGIALARRSDGLNALALAALVMVALSPSSLFELSLQLSFLAVASLLLLVPVLEQRLGAPALAATDEGPRRILKRALRAATQTAYASIAVTLAGLPLLAGAFGQVSLIGVVANTVALPLSGVLTLLAAGSAFASVFSETLAVPLVVLGTQLSHAFCALTHAFAQVPWAAMPVAAPSVALSVLWWVLLSAWALGASKLRFVAGAALVPTLAFLLWNGAPADDALEVTFLAVGHGDAVVVSHRGHHALIDGGGVPQGTDTGRRFVLPFLRQRGITRLDLAVLSHAHPDHGLGLASTLREVSTRTLWLSAASPPGPLLAEVTRAAGGATVEAVEAGHAGLLLGASRLQVLAPPQERALLEGENDHSLVLRLTHGEVSFLLTGDIEEAAEEATPWAPVTVLKAPHHGSSTSSTPAFVAATQPRYVVFCVGAGNRYGLPDEDVVSRYEATGARCYRTDRDGAVTFRSDGKTVKVETFLTPTERR